MIEATLATCGLDTGKMADASEPCKVHSAVFYEWKNHLSSHEMHQLMQKVVETIGIHPDQVTAFTDKKMLKTVSYAIYMQKFESLAGTFTGEMYRWFTRPKRNWQTNIALSWHSWFGLVEFHFRLPSDEAYRKNLLQSIEKIAECLQPLYGVGYSMCESDGPEAYAMGTQYTTYDNISGVKIAKHTHEADELRAFRTLLSQKDRAGILATKLRGIYEVNFLNPMHLNHHVSDQTLKSLIDYAELGELKELYQGLWQWDLNDVDQVRARKLLAGCGLFFSEAKN